MKKLLFALIIFVQCTDNKINNTMTKKHEQIVFVGTYTENLGFVDGKAAGIYTCSMDTVTGELKIINETTDIANPSFLTVSNDKKYLYAVAENGGKPTQPFGSVVAYKITEGYKLMKINEVSSYGVAPCHISIDNSGKVVMVANYGTGNVVTYKINENGALTDSVCMKKNPGKQAWAHQIFAKANDDKKIFVIDKGADKIFEYEMNANAELTLKNSTQTAKGAGPRHMEYSPNGKPYAYVLNENNSTINAFHVENTGKLTEIQTIPTLPDTFKGKNSGAEIFIHPNSMFLYASNRGHNSIAIYHINSETGSLTRIGYEPTQGEIPRNFLITPNGKMLLVANQNTNNVVAFNIDAATGKLTATGKISPIFTPVCLKML